MELDKMKSYMYDVIGAMHTVHRELGPGLNEKCYQAAFAVELEEQNIPFEAERLFCPTYKGRKLPISFRTDFICKGNIVVECKAVLSLCAPLRAQLFNYMRLLKMPYGIIVNFAPHFAEIERYFYNPENNEIVDGSGRSVRLAPTTGTRI